MANVKITPTVQVALIVLRVYLVLMLLLILGKFTYTALHRTPDDKQQNTAKDSSQPGKLQNSGSQSSGSQAAGTTNSETMNPASGTSSAAASAQPLATPSTAGSASKH